MKVRRIEKDIVRGLERNAEKIFKGLPREPFVSRQDYRRAISKKMRMNKPIADNLLKLLEARGKIYKKKRKYSYF